MASSGYGSVNQVDPDAPGPGPLQLPGVMSPEESGRFLDEFEIAAWRIEDAMLGLERPIPTTKRARDTYLAFLNMETPERAYALAALVALSYFEAPLWCRAALPDDSWWEWKAGEAQCPVPADGDYLYLSGLPYLPHGAALLVELACYGYLALLLRKELQWMGVDAFVASRFSLGRGALTVVAVADALVFALAPPGALGFRLAPFCRIGLVLLTDAMTKTTSCALAMVPAFARIFLLMAAAVFFLAWIAAMVLDDFTDANLDGTPMNEGFDGFGIAVYTMFMLSTTADFPAQMIPATAGHTALGLMFVLAVLVLCFLFLNLVLAVVYNEYSEHFKDRMKSFYAARNGKLQKAFKNLCPSGEMSRGQLDRVVAELNKSDVVAEVPPDMVDFLWARLDRDGSGEISAVEFMELCDVLACEYKVLRTRSYVEKAHPALFAGARWQAFVALVHSGAYARAVTALMVLNACAVFFESRDDLNDTDTPASTELWGWVEFWFSMAYLLDLALKLAATPLDVYLDDVKNRFDLCVTLVFVVVSVYWASPLVGITADMLHYFTILRLLRLLALLGRLRAFRVIVASVANILAACAPVLGLIFCISFAWSAAGVALFGGRLYAGSPALDGTDYEDSDYYLLNFNDLVLGLLPLFAMVTSGGPVSEVIDAAARARRPEGQQWVGYAFFISYYVVGVLVAFNIFSAFIIDAFISEYEAINGADGSLDDPDRDEVLLENEDLGYKVVVRGAGSRDDVYKKMFAEDLEDDGGGDEQTKT